MHIKTAYRCCLSRADYFRRCLKILHGRDFYLSYDLINRQSGATTDVSGGRPGPSSKLERRLCLSVEENNTQVVCVYVCVQAINTYVYIAGGYWNVPRGG